MSPSRAERPSDGAPPVDGLQAAVLSALRRHAGDLAARWTAQARGMLPLDRTDGREPGHLVEASGVVDALLAGLATDDGESEDAIGHGLRFGTEAFGSGVSLHHTIKALDLLTAMTLFAMESSLGDPDVPPGGVGDGIRLSRLLQRRAALLSLAVTRGYMQSYGEALRERFRHLRHDLRNPLGTIKSVLALMDDESVPLEARVNPSFRGMATRNARSLEELIADRLSDAAALLPAVATPDVSVRAIACSVRRELRSEAERRGVSILVDQAGPQGQLDAPGLELLLRGTIQAVLQECETGDQVRLEFEQSADRRATVIVSSESGHQPIRDPSALDRLAALAGHIGATITISDRILVSVQLRPSEGGASERERTVPRESVGLSDGETRHDVRDSRESHHGQAGAH